MWLSNSPVTVPPCPRTAPLSWCGIKVYYASEVTEGNEKTTFNKELGEQPLPADTTAGESERLDEFVNAKVIRRCQGNE